MAQRNARTSFWHKKCKGLSSKQQPIVAPDPSRVQSNHINRDSGGDDARKRRVIGVVEEEKIEILRFCAIGYCRQPYLMQELAKEFRAAGLEGFTVMRVFGSLVLLMFLNENQRWPILDIDVLQQWLENVMEWSPCLQVPNRRVWLFAWGVPMHAWSEVTFKRIVELWGHLISIDNETLAPSLFERARFFFVETDWVSHIDEMIELQLAVESDINSEAKVSTSKIVQPLEVHEVGDTSRMEERLSDASMEGTVVPNTVSPEVDLTKQLDRMWEGNMMEDLRVLEVSSLSRNWSNEEETCIVNRMDSSPSDAAGLKEVFIQENGIQEGIGDIVSLGGLFDVSSRIE
ncbi:hypothetical protein V6N12_027815 [Hibiscus sabdariffa]|uniref:DUF4283 domain-containing protein n=1 Tax=Hibiscus sabdariffa TaxID=183260 RepID=A0ABR2F406_9ROSI